MQNSRKYTFIQKKRGKLTLEIIKFKKNWIWDVLEIDCEE